MSGAERMNPVLAGEVRLLTRKQPQWATDFNAAARYKGVYGGRASGKSHEIAEALLTRCVRQKTRAVCIREVQDSLKESVRQLLLDKIQHFRAELSFEVTQDEIRGPHGSQITFRGMNTVTAVNIKSLEGMDVAWVEEAQTLSARSLGLLRPTIRKPGSELWFSWNPENDDDAIDSLFRGPHPPANSVVRRVNWDLNPYLSSEMIQEMAEDRVRDPELATHVWDGGYRIVTQGAYYAQLLADADNEGRVGDFPYDPSLPVHTSWDLGVDDYTAVVFFQERAQRVTVVDFFEVNGTGAPEIVRLGLPELVPAPQREPDWARAGRPYVYGTHYLPHDVSVREFGTGRARKLVMQELGVKPINVGRAVNPAERVNAVRTMLPKCYFNRATTGELLRHLRGYTRGFNRSTQQYTGPKHDHHSHAADAFGEMAINLHLTQPKAAPTPTKPRDSYSWGSSRRPGSASAWG